MQTESGEVVTKQRMEQLRLDALDLKLLSLLDRTRDRSEIVDALISLLDQQQLSVRHRGEIVADRDQTRELLRKQVDSRLRCLAGSAPLVA